MRSCSPRSRAWIVAKRRLTCQAAMPSTTTSSSRPGRRTPTSVTMSGPPIAPGLKSIEDATELRRRILLAFESAEYEGSDEARRAVLTFGIVGGGPTGVELAGAIKEIAGADHPARLPAHRHADDPRHPLRGRRPRCCRCFRRSSSARAPARPRADGRGGAPELDRDQRHAARRLHRRRVHPSASLLGGRRQGQPARASRWACRSIAPGA